jgi:hypothetical protein
MPGVTPKKTSAPVLAMGSGRRAESIQLWLQLGLQPPVLVAAPGEAGPLVPIGRSTLRILANRLPQAAKSALVLGFRRRLGRDCQ